MTQQVAFGRHLRRKLSKLARQKKCLYRRCGSRQVTPLERVNGWGGAHQIYETQRGTRCRKCGRKMWGPPR